MKISFSFSKGEISLNQGFEFMLMNITNPPSMAPSSSFSFEMYSKDDYLISRLTTGPTVSNKKPSNMT